MKKRRIKNKKRWIKWGKFLEGNLTFGYLSDQGRSFVIRRPAQLIRIAESGNFMGKH